MSCPYELVCTNGKDNHVCILLMGYTKCADFNCSRAYAKECASEFVDKFPCSFNRRPCKRVVNLWPKHLKERFKTY
jgi:hypothetical protein